MCLPCVLTDVNAGEVRWERSNRRETVRSERNSYKRTKSADGEAAHIKNRARQPTPSAAPYSVDSHNDQSIKNSEGFGEGTFKEEQGPSTPTGRQNAKRWAQRTQAKTLI